MTDVFPKDLSAITSKGYIGLNTMIQDANIVFLRQYFQSLKNPGPSDPKYDTSFYKTSISIEGDFPRKQVSYPLIVVSITDSGDLMNKMIGKDFYTPIYKKNSLGDNVKVGYQTSGVFTTQFTIYIASESTAERRDLIDLLVMLYRTIGTDFLRKKGLTITGIKYGSKRTEFLASDLVYFDSLVFTVQSEWKQIIHNIPLITDIAVEKVEIEEEPLI